MIVGELPPSSVRSRLLSTDSEPSLVMSATNSCANPYSSLHLACTLHKKHLLNLWVMYIMGVFL
jgi:hypothetical protein